MYWGSLLRESQEEAWQLQHGSGAVRCLDCRPLASQKQLAVSVRISAERATLGSAWDGMDHALVIGPKGERSIDEKLAVGVACLGRQDGSRVSIGSVGVLAVGNGPPLCKRTSCLENAACGIEVLQEENLDRLLGLDQHRDGPLLPARGLIESRTIDDCRSFVVSDGPQWVRQPELIGLHMVAIVDVRVRMAGLTHRQASTTKRRHERVP